MKKKKQIHIDFGEDKYNIKERMQKCAEKKYISLNAIFILAAIEYLKKEEKEK